MISNFMKERIRRVRRRHIGILLLAPVLLIASCREACYVGVEQPSNGMPVFHLKKTPRATEDGVSISRFTVARKVGKRYEIVWEIGTADISKPIRIKAITYGVVPPGFKAAPNVQRLVEGETYEVMTSRLGMVGGANFVFQGAKLGGEK